MNQIQVNARFPKIPGGNLAEFKLSRLAGVPRTCSRKFPTPLAVGESV